MWLRLHPAYSSCIRRNVIRQILWKTTWHQIEWAVSHSETETVSKQINIGLQAGGRQTHLKSLIQPITGTANLLNIVDSAWFDGLWVVLWKRCRIIFGYIIYDLFMWISEEECRTLAGKCKVRTLDTRINL